MHLHVVVIVTGEKLHGDAGLDRGAGDDELGRHRRTFAIPVYLLRPDLD